MSCPNDELHDWHSITKPEDFAQGITRVQCVKCGCVRSNVEQTREDLMRELDKCLERMLIGHRFACLLAELERERKEQREKIWYVVQRGGVA